MTVVSARLVRLSTEAESKYTLAQRASASGEWLLNLFKFFAKKNKKASSFQFWQSDNHPIVLYSSEVIVQKLDYIHNNPVRAKVVNWPQDYLYSSASNYLEQGQGIFEVELLDDFFATKL